MAGEHPKKPPKEPMAHMQGGSTLFRALNPELYMVCLSAVCAQIPHYSQQDMSPAILCRKQLQPASCWHLLDQQLRYDSWNQQQQMGGMQAVPRLTMIFLVQLYIVGSMYMKNQTQKQQSQPQPQSQ